MGGSQMVRQQNAYGRRCGQRKLRVRWLIATTGNIQNRYLVALFERHPDVIGEYLTGSPLIELSRNRLVAHSSNDTEK